MRSSTSLLEVVLDRSEAREGLSSNDQHLRLRAARYFQLAAGPDDLPVIQRAYDSEETYWVRQALEDAIRTASGDASHEVTPQEAEGPFPKELYRRALGETTGSLIHEVQPLLGRLKMAAMAELENYESSRTAQRIGQLDELVSALNNLRRATEPPLLREFELGAWVRSVVEDELNGTGFPEAVLYGTEHLVAVGDPGLLHLVLSNATRNAIEATVAAHPQPLPPLLVTWGDTDRAFWIAVADAGSGPPAGRAFAFRTGRSTKPGHLGMGLAVAAAAMDSLSGEIALTRREHSPGARLEFRWPKPGSKP